MKSMILSTMLIISPMLATAGMTNNASFKCKVNSFDEKMVSLDCSHKMTGHTARTPRSWLSANTNLRYGEIIKLDLTIEQFNQWASFNNRKAASENE